MFWREVSSTVGERDDVVVRDAAESDGVEDGGDDDGGGRSGPDGAIEAERKRKYPVDPRLA